MSAGGPAGASPGNADGGGACPIAAWATRLSANAVSLNAARYTVNRPVCKLDHHGTHHGSTGARQNSRDFDLHAFGYRIVTQSVAIQ